MNRKAEWPQHISIFTNHVKRVDLAFRRALYLIHSRGADLHQVEQPLPLRRLLWPVDFESGRPQLGQAPSQVDDLYKVQQKYYLPLQHINHAGLTINPGGKCARPCCFSCTHSEVVCDGTANFTFRFHGRLTYDVS